MLKTQVDNEDLDLTRLESDKPLTSMNSKATQFPQLTICFLLSFPSYVMMTHCPYPAVMLHDSVMILQIPEFQHHKDVFKRNVIPYKMSREKLVSKDDKIQSNSNSKSYFVVTMM